MANYKVVDRRRVTAAGARPVPPKPGDLPSISHKSILGPLMKAVRDFNEHVRRGSEDGSLAPEQFWVTVRGLLISSEQTYAAICILVAGNRPKTLPLQAAILSRALLESLGNLLALSEDPVKRSFGFGCDGYRSLFDEHQKLKAAFGKVAKWKSWLAGNERLLKVHAGLLGLTSEQAKNPGKHLPQRWPTPGGLLNKKKPMLTGTKRAAFQQVYDFWYATLSGYAHQRFRALSAAFLSDDPSLQWSPGRIESNVVSEATLFLLCILSEVEALGGFEPNVHLRAAWERVRPLDDMAETMVKLRYGKLLGL
jgi:hypothetical protein